MNKKTQVIEFERIPIRQFAEKAYLDYSMYVILDRALPHISDGLKPVQRRIIYAMSELGLNAAAKYKKSARTIGDVLGKYHPHGEVACYEAMVLMAQNFSYRYPLVDGQGNFGSPDDPKSFAAMRYTESRLSPYAQSLLAELEQGTVDWQPNFDGTLEEPLQLPARLPNILLNGASGIAVGMATDIPPHNLNEVVKACIYLLENPEAKLADILKFIKGPDFPTQAEIISSAQEIKQIYKTGNGSIRQRAVYKQEDQEIIIHALPYQVSGSKILEQIAAQMQAKKLPQVVDLRDESDHETPTRLAIVLRSNRVDAEELMSHLFATTDLERSYKVNLNMVGLNQKPKVKNLLEILQEWLEYRKKTVIRRIEHRLQKLAERLHILDGLIIAYLNLDKIIHIIRTEDDPKAILMKKFKLDEIQVTAILETRLRQLAKLEEKKIREEQKILKAEQESLEKILKSKKLLNELIRKELTEDAEKYGDKRMSPIIHREEAQAFKVEDMIPTEAITVILSQKGWVRAAKGHEIDPTTLSYRTGDQFLTAVPGKSNQLVTFVDSTGRSYTLPAHSLPSARGQGEPLTSKLAPPPGAEFVSAIIDEPESLYLIAADNGYGFIVKYEELISRNKNGKSILKLKPPAKALSLQKIHNIEADYLAAVTNLGHLLIFPIAELPQLNKGKGNKIIQIPKSPEKTEWVVAIKVLAEAQPLTIIAANREMTLQMKNLEEFHGSRAQRGKKLPRALRTVNQLK